LRALSKTVRLRIIDIIISNGYYINMYSTKEAAEKLGLSPDHVKLLARTGQIKAKKLGRDWIILSLNYQRKRKLKNSKGARK